MQERAIQMSDIAFNGELSKSRALLAEDALSSVVPIENTEGTEV
jgi:hypothetical protein